MAVRIAGEQMYLWRAVDSEGEVLDVLVQRRRDKAAAKKLMRMLLKKQGFAPAEITTDKLRSYGLPSPSIRAAPARHEQGLRKSTGPRSRNSPCDGENGRGSGSSPRVRPRLLAVHPPTTTSSRPTP